MELRCHLRLRLRSPAALVPAPHHIPHPVTARLTAPPLLCVWPPRSGAALSPFLPPIRTPSAAICVCACAVWLMVAMQQERVRGAAAGGGGRHGSLFWQEEGGSVGLRLMQRMGWKEGKGLGKGETGHASHSVRARKKLDQAGLGASTALSADARQHHFAQATTSLFNDLLQRLNQQHRQPQAEGEEEGQRRAAEEAYEEVKEADEGEERRRALSSLSRAVGRRALYGRFSRAKDTATYSTSSMHEILGTTTHRTTTSSNSSHTSASPPLPATPVECRTSHLSMSEYFSNRMRSRVSGAAVDSFQVAHFDDLHRASAVGRGGLGFHPDAPSRLSPLSQRSADSHTHRPQPQPHTQQQPHTPPQLPQPTEVEVVDGEVGEEEAAAAKRRKEERRERKWKRRSEREREGQERRKRRREEGHEGIEAEQLESGLSAAAGEEQKEVVNAEKGNELMPADDEQEAATASPVQNGAGEGGEMREASRRRKERKRRLQVEQPTAQ